MWLLFLKAVCLFWCSSNYLIICTEKTNNQQTNNNGSCCLTAHDVLCLASCVHTLMKQIKNMCGKTKSILLSPAFPTFHSTCKWIFLFPSLLPHRWPNTSRTCLYVVLLAGVILISLTLGYDCLSLLIYTCRHKCTLQNSCKQDLGRDRRYSAEENCRTPSVPTCPSCYFSTAAFPRSSPAWNGRLALGYGPAFQHQDTSWLLPCTSDVNSGRNYTIWYQVNICHFLVLFEEDFSTLRGQDGSRLRSGSCALL